MKPQRVFGLLWIAFCGIPGVLLLSNLPAIWRVAPSPRFYLAALLGVLYCAGALAGISLFLGARSARRFAGGMAALILAATIAQIVAFKLPIICGIVAGFVMVSVVLLFLRRQDTVA